MNKIYALVEKVWNNGDKTAEPVSETVKPQMPWLGMIFGPYLLFMDNTRCFFRLGGIYALILSVVALLFKNGFGCSIAEMRAGGYCAASSLPIVLSFLTGMFVMVMFCRRWCRFCLLRQPWNWREVLRPGRDDVKLYGLLLLFIALSLISVLSFYLLYIRVPNPDWRIELVYFGVVSLGFLVPLLLIRFYALFAFLMSGEKMPTLKAVWSAGSGTTLKVLSALLLLFLIAVFSQMSLLNLSLIHI